MQPKLRLTFAGHVVRKGDTLSGIAQRYGVSVAALQQANGMRGATVKLGQSLRVPATGTTVVRSSTRSGSGETTRSHRVERGQTLTHIARRYGVSLERLRAANGLRGSSSLRAGQVLRIPQGG
jgi:N-acetylmuramoyl-L-alanine amidase